MKMEKIQISKSNLLALSDLSIKEYASEESEEWCVKYQAIWRSIQDKVRASDTDTFEFVRSDLFHSIFSVEELLELDDAYAYGVYTKYFQ